DKAMMVMAFQSSPIFSLPRARLECSEVIFRFMRSVGVCVLLIIMDGPGEKRLASVKRYAGLDPKRTSAKSRQPFLKKMPRQQFRGIHRLSFDEVFEDYANTE